MKNYRIVERTFVNGDQCFIIQKRRFLFRWLWFDYYDDDFQTTHFKNTQDALDYVQAIDCRSRYPSEYTDKVIYSRKEKLEKLLEG